MTGENLARLGHYVTGRRVALGYKQRTDLASVMPLTDRTLARIEKEHKPCEPGTYAIVENALEWRSGSIAAILAGGEPTEIARPSPQPRSEHWLADVPTGELIGEIRELFTELRRRIPEVDAVVNEPQDWSQSYREGLRGESPPMRRRQDGEHRN
jgi:hypothetical protein